MKTIRTYMGSPFAIKSYRVLGPMYENGVKKDHFRGRSWDLKLYLARFNRCELSLVVTSTSIDQHGVIHRLIIHLLSMLRSMYTLQSDSS